MSPEPVLCFTLSPDPLRPTCGHNVFIPKSRVGSMAWTLHGRSSAAFTCSMRHSYAQNQQLVRPSHSSSCGSSINCCPAQPGSRSPSRSYFMSTLWPSQLNRRVLAAAAAGQAPATVRSGMQGSVDPVYLRAAAYLSEVGFTSKTEIARVLDIAMNPNSLFVTVSANVNARLLDVEADMRPVVEYLRAQGVSAGDVVKVITAHPPVLSYSVEGRLVPFWEYLTSIGVSDVAAAVAKRPSLLGLSVDANLRKIVDYLQYVETPPDKIVQYICNSI